jgi:hypothetical protein
MENRGMKIKQANLRGGVGGVAVYVAGIEEGLHLSKPWGEATDYDFIVEDRGGRAGAGEVDDARGSGRIFVHGAGERGAVPVRSFDYLAAYVLQEDMWYIIPAEMVVGQGSIAMYPRLKRSKYGV